MTTPILIRIIIAAAAALGTVLLATPLMIRLASKVGAIDHPDERKVHKESIPRLGGLAIFLAFVCGTLILWGLDEQVFALLLACSVIVLMGYLDDTKNVSPVVKLSFQVVAALVLVQSGVYVSFLTNPFTGEAFSLGVFGIPLTVIWLVGVSNAVNLIDGLDGLASGVSAICASTIAALGFLTGSFTIAGVAVVLAVASAGFLRYNFPPAKIFMGDCGALFLGFVLGALSIMGMAKSAAALSIFVPILILGLPIFDTFFAIARRFRARRPVMQADRGHLHHRLLDLGLSTWQVVTVLYVVTFLMGLAAILLTLLTTPQAVVILIIVTVLFFLGANKLGILRRSETRKLQRDHT
ncbi:MAG: undecaprenyl/decaprenyl-phosphate alpha-N-acetylglucosaminyl 1-phosphate transferase [Clostridiales bacterium]|nr:undecaprenyl/decaprenyl-phosphate alpha-N-acetylglucosaminyl 1-phosphate transferase [Clostridiales bacterium]